MLTKQHIRFRRQFVPLGDATHPPTATMVSLSVAIPADVMQSPMDHPLLKHKGSLASVWSAASVASSSTGSSLSIHDGARIRRKISVFV